MQILVTTDQTQGFYAVGVAVDALGARNVAVAAQETGGVWLSSEGGAPSSFRKIGLAGRGHPGPQHPARRPPRLSVGGGGRRGRR